MFQRHIRQNRLFIGLLIIGSYWYRLFTAGSSTLGKSNLFSIIVVGIFFCVFSNRNNSVTKSDIIKSTARNYSIITIYAFASVIWSIVGSIALRGAINYLITALILIELQILIKSKDDFDFACRLVLYNTVATLALSLYESITGNYLLQLTSSPHVMTWVYGGFHSPIAQYNHPNNVACTLALSIPFCFWYLNRQKRNLFANVILTLSTSITLFAANSRFSIVALALYFILIIWQSKRINRTLTIIFMVLIGIVFVISIPGDRITGVFESNAINDEARPLIWKNAFQNFLKSNGVGVGVGNAYIANEKSAVYAYIGRPCHNYILEVFEELGLVGGFSWCIWYFSCWKKGVSIRSIHNNQLINLFSNGMLLFVLLTIQQSSLLGQFTVWTLIGLSVSIPCFIEQEENEENNSI